MACATVLTLALVACVSFTKSHGTEQIKFGAGSLERLNAWQDDDTATSGFDDARATASLSNMNAGLMDRLNADQGDEEDADAAVPEADFSESSPTSALDSAFGGSDESTAEAPAGSESLNDGDNVEVQYVVRLKSTGQEVYRQMGPGDGGSFTFELGGGHVIPGFDTLVGSLKVGDEVNDRTITADQAYGSKGFKAMGIPPDADLEYDIKVVGKQ